MKKLTLGLVFGIFIFLSGAQSQSLVNALYLNSINIEKDGKAIENDAASGHMVIAYNKTPFKVFESNEVICWVEVSYKTCGKKVKLKRKTVVEMNNGDKFSGKTITEQYKIGEDDPGYFLGQSNEEFSIGDKEDSKVVVSYSYELRYKGHSLANK